LATKVVLFILRSYRALFIPTTGIFLILIWLAWPAGFSYELTLIVSCLGAVLTVPVHELGHILAARQIGAKTLRIGSGRGRVFVETERLSRRSTAVVAAAGPAASALAALAVVITSWLLAVPELAIASIPWGLPAISIIPPARDGMLVFTDEASRVAEG
jgi:hypothetical protein